MPVSFGFIGIKQPVQFSRMGALALQSLSDEDLIRQAQATSFERQVEKACSLSFVITPILTIIASLKLFGVLSSGTGWSSRGALAIGLAAIVGLLLSLPLTLMVYALMFGLCDRRRSKYRRELERRYGQGPFAAYVEEAEQTLAKPEGPDWIVLVQTRGLPYGDVVWIRIELKNAVLVEAKVRSFVGPPIYRVVQTGEQPRIDLRNDVLQHEDALSLCDEVKKALSVLVDPSIPKTHRFDVTDGAPCDFALLQRSPKSKWLREVNLATPGDHPHALFVRAMLKTTKTSHK